MSDPFISVVVCTYNRRTHLERCLKSLKDQEYKNFEIIVVNGPSNDGTDAVLRDYPKIYVISQNELNGLSNARNLGIMASKGEIIAFIDDDAVADKNWLDSLVSGYSDITVGGVGGLVYGPEKSHLQFDNGIINKSGLPEAIRPHGKKLKKDEFQILMGTNCSFKREVLYSVGGFDPYFKYYHDESDLCVRIALRGYRIVYQRSAFVVHDMVEGHNRRTPYDLNWYEILKNVIYFTLKNFHCEIRSYTTRPIYSTLWWLHFFLFHFLNHRISGKQLFHIYRQVLSGVMKGYRDGMKSELNKYDISVLSSNYSDNSKNVDGINWEEKHNPIKNEEILNKNFKIALISQEYARDCTGGICRYTYDLAHELGELGNEVHIVTRSGTNECHQYMDNNIFIHAVVSEPIDTLSFTSSMQLTNKNISYSNAVCIKLLELIRTHGIQIVEAPLWDSEGFVFSLLKPRPLIVRIETPLCKVVEIQGWEVTKDLKFANWMEGETLRRADKIIAISEAIGNLICKHHQIPKEKIEVSPLGITIPREVPPNNSIERITTNVLFVGRIERRKGIDTLFKAIPQIIANFANVRFTIVGSDTAFSVHGDSYKEFLLKNLDEKFHPYVSFKGFIPDIMLQEYYKNCDIFIAPSLYESFGLIYLEAMAWGKPVIGCDVGGVPEIIVDGETGIIIPPGDVNALTEAIALLICDKDKREKMGKMAFERVKRIFTKEMMAENALKIYSDLLLKNN